jgi:hypothetical protein
MKKCVGLFICASLFLITEQAISQEADSISVGYLKISVNVDSFLVVLNQEFHNPIQFTNEDSISLETGYYSVLLAHPEYRDLRLGATIRSERPQRLVANFSRGARFDSTQSSYTRITEGIDYNITIQTDPNSLIIIDDSTYGRGYYSGDIGPYRHNIRVEHTGARPKSESVYIEPSGRSQLTLYALPEKSKARWYGLIPGSSQVYKNQTIKGALFATTITASVVYGVLKQLNFSKQNSEYEDMLIQYETITDEQFALEYGNRVENQFNRVNNLASNRDYAIYAAAGLYIANILDALLSKPASGYRINVEPADFEAYANQGAGLSLQFGIR